MAFKPASTVSARVLAAPKVSLGYSLKYQRISANSASVKGTGKLVGGAVSGSEVPVYKESCTCSESDRSII